MVKNILYIYNIYEILYDNILNNISKKHTFNIKSINALDAAYNGIDYTINSIIKELKEINNNNYIIEEYNESFNTKNFKLVNNGFSSSLLRYILITIEKNIDNIYVIIECVKY